MPQKYNFQFAYTLNRKFIHRFASMVIKGFYLFDTKCKNHLLIAGAGEIQN